MHIGRKAKVPSVLCNITLLRKKQNQVRGFVGP